jgi:hypothetical protein
MTRIRKNLDLYPEPEYFMLTGNNRNQNFIDKKEMIPVDKRVYSSKFILTQKRQYFLCIEKRRDYKRS